MKYLLPLLIIVIAACNSGTGNSADVSSKSHVWDSANRYEFIQACMEEQKAKAEVSDTILYSFCKCMLEQVEQRYPNPDSVSVIDSATLRQMQQHCAE